MKVKFTHENNSIVFNTPHSVICNRYFLDSFSLDYGFIFLYVTLTICDTSQCDLFYVTLKYSTVSINLTLAK